MGIIISQHGKLQTWLPMKIPAKLECTGKLVNVFGCLLQIQGCLKEVTVHSLLKKCKKHHLYIYIYTYIFFCLLAVGGPQFHRRPFWLLLW